MSDAPRAPAAARDLPRGFVLVGVVILVLALTILGLSLYSLSSFEAQFLGRSVNEAQAFHVAAGGVERAKFALAVTGRLDSVRHHLPEHVDSTWAVQRQGGADVSSGPVDWAGEDVLIRAVAGYRGAVHAVEGRFTPQLGTDFYRRLVTASGGMTVPLTGGAPPPTPRRGQTVLTGEIWLDDDFPDTSWTAGLPPPLGQRPIAIRDVPRPRLDDFFARHWATATDAVDSGGRRYFLAAPPGGVGFYRSAAPDPGNNRYSLHIPDLGPAPEIHVNGAVVWMFDRGFRSQQIVTVVGNGAAGDRLVMVGKPSTEPSYNIGIWAFGSIRSPSVPLILVSDGDVRIEHFNSHLQSATVNYLSIYAHHVWLMGPQAPFRLELTHPQLANDTVIDELLAMDALPSASPDRKRLVLVPGTWRQESRSGRD